MANPTMTLISSQTVGAGGVASVTFSSIPATYTDLVLKVSARSARVTGSAADTLSMAFNGSPSFTTIILDGGSPYGTPRSFTSGAYAGDIDSNNNTVNIFSNLEIYIPNYSLSNNKLYRVDSVAENNSGTGDYLVQTSLSAGLATLTTAITTITLTAGTGSNLVQYSSFSLYGIKNS